MAHFLNEWLDDLKPLFSRVDKHAHTDQALYGFLEHDKLLNSKLGLSMDLDLFSVMLMSADESNKDDKGFYNINIKIDLVWFNQQERGYYHSFPKPFNQYRCPKKIDTSALLKWNPETNYFIFRGQKALLKDVVSIIIKMHLRTTKNGFSFLALTRSIRWFLSSLFSVLIKIALTISNITSGTRKILGKEIYNDKASIINESKYDYKINTNDHNKIEFFGMQVDFIPLVTYSFVNLSAYFLCYFMEFKPPVLKYLFNNAFLVILYVILTYSIMNYCVPKVMIYLAEKLNTAMNKMVYDKIPILKK